jgi:hypothetical protein
MFKGLKGPRVNILSFFQGRLLAPVAVSGLILTGILLLAIFGVSIFFASRRRPESLPGTFYGSLRGYDAFAADSREPSGAALLNRMLDKIDRQDLPIDSRLSLLKRRRSLAKSDSRYLPAYREAAVKAAAQFPYSQPLAALAAAALIQDAPITEETEKNLRPYIPLLTEERWAPLSLGIRILCGGMKDSSTASAVPYLEELISDSLPLLRINAPLEETEGLITDLAILRTFSGNSGDAGALLIAALNESGIKHSAEFLRFAAEFFYDYGEPLRAAGIFSRLDTDADLIREADALWLAGYGEAARNIWTILVSPRADDALYPPEETGAAGNFASGGILLRGYYNLAGAAADRAGAAAALEKLYTTGIKARAFSEVFTYGTIRYTRLLPAPEALAILETAEARPGALIDLEKLRRRAESWHLERTIAEVWLLLGRHPGEEDLYQWAAWYFSRQKRFEEAAELLKGADRIHLNGQWLLIHKGLLELEKGNISRGEELLRNIDEDEAPWEVHANLGRVLESRRAPAAALEKYERAASLAPDQIQASRIQFRIALCLKSLGRPSECIRVLEYSLDLNPDNLSARLELRRLSTQ